MKFLTNTLQSFTRSSKASFLFRSRRKKEMATSKQPPDESYYDSSSCRPSSLTDIPFRSFSSKKEDTNAKNRMVPEIGSFHDHNSADNRLVHQRSSSKNDNGDIDIFMLSSSFTTPSTLIVNKGTVSLPPSAKKQSALLSLPLGKKKCIHDYAFVSGKQYLGLSILVVLLLVFSNASHIAEAKSKDDSLHQSNYNERKLNHFESASKTIATTTSAKMDRRFEEVLLQVPNNNIRSSDSTTKEGKSTDIDSTDIEKNNEGDLRRVVEILPNNYAENKKDINQQSLTATTSTVENSIRLAHYETDRMATNVALGKPTSQSTTHGGYVSSRAVDGNQDGNSNYITHTTTQSNPWWWVDLQNSYEISSINIFNRVDCCSNRLANFQLKIFNSGKVVWTYKHSGTPSSLTVVHVPSKVLGDKVEISLLGGGRLLSLAEVEVLVNFCPAIDIPATHATPGEIQYNTQHTSINGWYPAGTKANFQCPYNPSWRHSDETTCQSLTGWDKDVEKECRDKNQDNGHFRILPNSFDRCPSFMYLSKEDCRKAGLSLGGKLRNGSVVDGSWSWVPFGCSIQGSGDIHYNSFQGQNDGNYQPVCSKGSFTLLPTTYKGGCPSSMDISKEDCVAAGLSAGGRLRNGNLIEESQNHLPFGCSMTSNGNIHYNSNINGINDGNYASLCHEGCKSLNIPATHATPGRISYDKQIISKELNYPTGTKAAFTCAYNPLWTYSDETICQAIGGDWDKDPNNECAEHKHEDDEGFRLLPKSFDMCPISMTLSKEDCKLAGLAVGGALFDGKEVKEESLGTAPFGCSINVSAGAGYILYNSLRGKNDGNYQPVCGKGSFKLLPASDKRGCPSLTNVSKEDCVAAGLSAGGKLRNGNLVEGSWDKEAPFGCFIYPGDYSIHYNNNQKGTNPGNQRSLCHELLLPGQILAKYYNNNAESLPWSTDIDSLVPDETNYVRTISFPFHHGLFASSSFDKKLFARFEGWLTLPLSGKYELCLRVNDSVTLYIDHQMIYNGNPNVPILCVEYNVIETNIQKHVQVDMVDQEGGHQLILDWQRPGDIVRTAVPASFWSKKPGQILATYYSNNLETLPWSTDLDALIPDEASYVPTVNFPLQRNGPFATSSFTKNFFARFEGWLTFPLPGKYELCLQFDNYAKLYIDHQMTYESKPGVMEHCVEYYNPSEKMKYVQLDMADWGLDHKLIFMWKQPGDLSHTVVPASLWSRQEKKPLKLYKLSSTHSKCRNKDTVLEMNCKKAGKIFEDTTDSDVIHVELDNVPFGCSIQHKTGLIHYNINKSGKNNGGFNPICQSGNNDEKDLFFRYGKGEQLLFPFMLSTAADVNTTISLTNIDTFNEQCSDQASHAIHSGRRGYLRRRTTMH